MHVCEMSFHMNLAFASLIFATQLYIKSIFSATMIRALTYGDLCAQLGIAENDLFVDSNDEDEEGLTKVKMLHVSFEHDFS